MRTPLLDFKAADLGHANAIDFEEFAKLKAASGVERCVSFLPYAPPLIVAGHFLLRVFFHLCPLCLVSSLSFAILTTHTHMSWLSMPLAERVCRPVVHLHCRYRSELNLCACVPVARAHCLHRGELKAIFNAIDVDGNGAIDRQEYLAFTGPRTPCSPFVAAADSKEPRVQVRQSSLRKQGAGRSSPGRHGSSRQSFRDPLSHSHVYVPRFVGDDARELVTAKSTLRDSDAHRVEEKKKKDGFSEWELRLGRGSHKGGGAGGQNMLTGVGCTLERRYFFLFLVRRVYLR